MQRNRTFDGCDPKVPPLLLQRRPHPLRDQGRIVVDRKRRRAFKSMRSSYEDAKVSGNPRFVRPHGGPAASDHGRLNASRRVPGTPLMSNTVSGIRKILAGNGEGSGPTAVVVAHSALSHAARSHRHTRPRARQSPARTPALARHGRAGAQNAGHLARGSSETNERNQHSAACVPTRICPVLKICGSRRRRVYRERWPPRS